MKRLLLASTVLAFGGQILGDQALAAPPRPPVPSFSWTGCYIGAHAGAGWSHTNISDPTGLHFPTSSPDVNSGGKFIGGGQLGCNYQFAPNWVVGLQGDMTWGSLSGQTNDPFFAGKNFGGLTASAKTTWIASVAPRIGYTWNNVLLFGTAGPAWAHNTYSLQNLVNFGIPNTLCVNGCNPSGSETRVGLNLGIGFEWAFANNWSAGLVYNHYDFGSHNVTLDNPSGIPGDISVRQRIDTAKVTLNYRFGWMGR
jgi:outer membrane immunogenic protein